MQVELQELLANLTPNAYSGTNKHIGTGKMVETARFGKESVHPVPMKSQKYDEPAWRSDGLLSREDPMGD